MKKTVKTVFMLVLIAGLILFGFLVLGNQSFLEMMRDYAEPFGRHVHETVRGVLSFDAAAAYIREIIPKLKYVFTEAGIFDGLRLVQENRHGSDLWEQFRNVLDRVKNLPCM